MERPGIVATEKLRQGRGGVPKVSGFSHRLAVHLTVAELTFPGVEVLLMQPWGGSSPQAPPVSHLPYRTQVWTSGMSQSGWPCAGG